MNEEEKNTETLYNTSGDSGSFTPPTPEPPAPDSNSNSAPPPQPNPSPPRTFTQAELDEIVKDRAARAKASTEKSILEKLGIENVDTAAELIKKARDAELANLSELDRMKAEAEEVKKALTEAQRIAAEREEALKTERLNTVVTAALTQAGTVDAEIAVKALNLADFTDDKGDIATDAVKRAVEALKASKPYLFNNSNYKGLPSHKGANPDHDPKAEKALQDMRRRKGLA